MRKHVLVTGATCPPGPDLMCIFTNSERKRPLSEVLPISWTEKSVSD